MAGHEPKKPVRTHTGLIVWQLASELRRLVLLATRTGAVAKDYDYRRQIRRSVRSACYLTSEGFYRYEHGDFGNYLRWAQGSLGEALDQIGDGLEDNYFTEEQHRAMVRICLRAMKANVTLRASWTGPAPDGYRRQETEGPPPTPQKFPRARRRRPPGT